MVILSRCLLVVRTAVQTKRTFVTGAEIALESKIVFINMSDDPYAVTSFPLGLRTLGSCGESTGRVKVKERLVPIFPIVRAVVAHLLDSSIT